MTTAEKPKHTPGPWKLRSVGRDVLAIVAHPQHDHYEVEVSRSVTNIPGLAEGEEWSANARLIAAAPEMLEALEDIVEQWETTRQRVPADLSDSIRVFAQAAIRKARGEQ